MLPFYPTCNNTRNFISLQLFIRLILFKFYFNITKKVLYK